jgi:carboxyl-terminal processing protease
MKRTYFILLVFSLLLLINTSCNDNDKINDKGELETVTYDAGTKTFKLTYSSGYTETINAIINNQVDPPVATATLEDGSIVTFENANNSGKAEIITSDVISDYKYVNGWIYDNMSVYYLWNDKLSNSPN